MDWIPLLIAILSGFALGLAVAFALRLVQARTAKDLAEEIFIESEVQRRFQLEGILENIKSAFGSLSLEALGKSTDEFLKLAKSRFDSEREIAAGELDAKKGLIDEQLRRMTRELENLSTLAKDLEKDRVQKFGELASQLRHTREQTAQLVQTTGALREALASPKARGQWGERMAADVLRLAGFIEGVNYLKQKTVEGGRTRPDFTFLLPKDLLIHMDVKFPLDNYMRHLESESDTAAVRFRNDFLKDVRARVKEISGREYIDPEKNTLDYALLFIPNEQVYAFIQEQDSTIMDEALKNKVILCSPLTLFAVLAVIRQAVDNFTLEQTSKEILSLLGAFKKQWDLFVAKLDLLGKRIADTQREYEQLVTTRRRQLERPLVQIEEFRTGRQLPPSAVSCPQGTPEDENE